MSYHVVRKFPTSSGLNPESEIGYVFKIAQLQNGLAMATQDRSVRILDLERWSLSHQIVPAHDSTITDIQQVPINVTGAQSGNLFITASNDGMCKVWDSRSVSPVVSIRVSNNSFDAPVFGASVSGAGVCAVSCDTNISLFRFGEWNKYFEYSESHFQTISFLQFSPLANQENILVSGAEDGLVNIYNVADLVNEDNGQCPILTLNPENAVRSCFLSPRNNMFVFTGTETLSIWDCTTGGRVMPDNDSLRTHPLLVGNAEDFSFAYLVGMDSDCNRLLVANASGKMIECDTCNYAVNKIFQDNVHAGVVRSAVYIRGTDKVITAGEDGCIYEWSSGPQDAPVQTTGSYSRLAKQSVSARPY